MSYIYTAVIQYQDSNGRFVNLTAAATVTAYDLAGNSIANPTITNLVTGVYKVSVTQADLEDVVFRVVPHVDDQANFDDVAVMQEKVYHVADDILVDTGTTIPATIATVDTVVDAVKVKTDQLTFTQTNKVDAYLTQTAAQITAAVSGSSITDIRGNTWDIDVASLTLDSNKIQFTIKRELGDTDAESLLLVDTTTGLLYINGVAATLAQNADASLSYTGTTLTIAVDASITALLPIGSWRYGIQSVTAAGVVSEPYGGTFVITADAVRATA